MTEIGDRVEVVFTNGDRVTGIYRGIDPPITQTGEMVKIRTCEQVVWWARKDVLEIRPLQRAEGT